MNSNKAYISSSIKLPFNILPIAFILILAFISLYPVLQADFLSYDDDIMVVNNAFIKSINVDLLKSSFKFSEIIHYHPLVYLSFALEFRLFGLNPFFFHLTNLILHLFNVIFVYYCIIKINKNTLIAFFTASLFAIHPIHVESIAWVTERKDLLYAAFYLVSLIFYIKYKKSKTINYYYYSLLFFVLSCLSKSMAVTLPIVLLLLDYKILKKIENHIKEKIPFFIISVIFAVINFIVSYYKTDLPDYNLYDRISLVFYSILFYPLKLLFPANLSAIYLYPDKAGLLYLISPLILLLFVFLLSKLKKFSGSLSFGLLFYIITILPVLPFIPFGISLTADRFSYIPSLGLFYIISVFFYKCFNTIKKNPKFKQLVFDTIFLLLISMSFFTYSRSKTWNNTETLMNDVLLKNERNYYACYILGNYYFEKQNYSESIKQYLFSIKIKPDYANAYFNLGNVYFYCKNFNESIKSYQKAIELNPDDMAAYNNLGVVYENRGNFFEAINNYRIAAKLGYEPAKYVLKYYGY